MVVFYYETYQLTLWFTGSRWLAQSSLQGHVFGENLLNIHVLNQQLLNMIVSKQSSTETCSSFLYIALYHFKL